MSKISLIGHRADQDKLIETLMNLGVVEINTQEAKLQDKSWNTYIEKDSFDDRVSEYEELITKTATAIESISEYSKEKQPFLRTRKLVTDEEFSEVLSSKEEISKKILNAQNILKRISEIKAEENHLKGLILSLEPWKSFSGNLEFEGSKSTYAQLGLLPETANLSDMREKLDEKEIPCCFEEISKDKNHAYAFIAFHKEKNEEVREILKTFGFSRVTFKDMKGPPEENLKSLNDKLGELTTECLKLEADLSNMGSILSSMRFFYDDLIMARDAQKIKDRFLKTQHTFYLDGYLPEETSETVLKALEEYPCIPTVTQPEKGEECPVLLRNNGAVVPFEAVTDLYGLPKYNSIDATPVFAFFYAMFFGMMLSDAAYGIILSLGCFICLKKFRLEGTIKKMFTMLCYCGISTIFWGALFGSWFGDVVTKVGELFFGVSVTIPALWLEPVSDPMTLLFFSLAFGLVHIFVGMGVKAYLLIREGKALDAIFDIGSWYIFIIGLVMLIGGDTVKEGLSETGKYISIAGGAMLVLTQGRTHKNPIMKVIMGVGSLYKVTNYLSDVLSYSRLLALGMGTGIIASLVNTMGGLFGNSVLGAILFTIIFVGGHSFNIAINSLSAFVHSCRLQYVEFFSRFYEEGGRPFVPFKKATKYIHIVGGGNKK